MLAPEMNLGPYRLISRLGAGGMGEVWKAEDTRLARVVAIKVLSQSFAQDTEATARLKREARTAAQLYHPNIATIHSIEQDGDVMFIVMEFVEGDPLTKVLARGAMSEAEICRVGRSVADALAEAHQKGIVHRDIKPDNIIVTATRVKVLDFGIAKQVGMETTSSNAPTAFVTQQGMILGTVHYMSPEQALGKELDARTDIFSLGVVLYEAATGKLPFAGDTVTETMMHIIRDEPPDAATVNPKISAGLRRIIDRCLRKKKELRYESAADLASALEQQLGQASTAPYTAQTVKRPVAASPTVMTEQREKVPASAPRRTSRWLWVTLGVILLAAGIIGALATRTTKPSPAPAPKPVAAAVTTTTQPPQPASTASVSVTAQPQIVETTTTAAPAAPPPATETHAAAPPPPAPVAENAVPTVASLDALYEQGVSALASGDKPSARKTFLDIEGKDPHYAKAHFRLGEIAVLNHNLGYARTELELGWSEKEKMDARERHLTRLCLAICNANRFEAQKVGFEIDRMWPGDPDVAAIRAAYPPDERIGRPGRRFRP